MDLVRRLILGGLFALIFGPSFAATWSITTPSLGGQYSSASAACTAWSSQVGALASSSVVQGNRTCTTTKTMASLVATGTPSVFYCAVKSDTSCTDGYSASVTNTPSAVTKISDSDPVNNCPSAGTVEGTADNSVYAASSLSSTICLGEGTQGCVWRPAGIASSGCLNGKCYMTGPFVATGASCNPSSTVPGAPQSVASAPDTDANCVAQGKCPGTVNGTTVCVPCSSKTQESSTSSSSAASSAASGTSPSTSSESGTTTSKTECSGSQCTTTTKTTSTKSDGSTQETSSTRTEPQADYCAENPKAPVCEGEDESQWGGACAGGFTCKGDAVQCAQAQAGYDLSCAAKTDPNNPTVMAGNAAINAGDRPPGHPALEPEMFDVQGSLDVTNPFGSSCPSDIQISVIGTSVAIPLSGACDVLRVLGFVAVAFSLLGAGRLVVGAL